MINKKGVSAVVATVLIIMITVAAVAIVWMTVIPMIKDTANDGITEFNAQKSIEIVREGYTCANQGTGNSSVQISRDASTNVNITKLSVQWMAGGNTANTTDCLAPSINGNVVCTLDMATATVNVTGVRVAPVIQNGQAEKELGALPEVALPACA
ncbi:hypothetical protein H8D36_07120 [archaeon]|nr:hypothetical protein [archaeon]